MGADPFCFARLRGSFRMTVRALYLPIFTALVFAQSAALAQDALTIPDALSTTAFMDPAGDADSPVSISPDGNRYLIRLVTPEASRNRLRITVMAGRLDDRAAARPTIIATTYSSGLGNPASYGAADDISAAQSALKWVDNDHVSYLQTNEAGARNVLIVDLANRTSAFATSSATDIVSYDVSRAGTIVYLARSLPPPNAQSLGGAVIPDQADIFSMLHGQLSATTIFDAEWNSSWFMKKPGEPARSMQIGGQSVDKMFPRARFVSVSPDGRRALLYAWVSDLGPFWEGFASRAPYGPESLFASWLATARNHPASQEAREMGQIFTVDLTTGESKPLWDAPGPFGRADELKATWWPNSQRVRIGPVLLPNATSTAAPANFETVDYSFPDGAIMLVSAGAFHPLSPRENVPAGSPAEAPKFAATGSRRGRGTYEITVAENLNLPPRLVLRPTSGRKQDKVLLDPNVALRKYRLGRVSALEGDTKTGEHWKALLYLPVGYQPGRKYPLVIQSEGPFSRRWNKRFSLFGPTRGLGLAVPEIASYSAQVLSNRGFAVAQVTVDAPLSTPREAAVWTEFYKTLSSRLASEGIVDPKRVGLIGFSRTGYYVLSAISEPGNVFGAAIADDSTNMSYVQTTLFDDYGQAEGNLGGVPFGDGLQNWIKTAPGFRLGNVQTPVRLVGQSPSSAAYLLGNWEIFARLRHLKKPVEMYLMPSIDNHPSHLPANPGQVEALQTGAVDWFLYWLGGTDRGSIDSRSVARWDQLRILQSTAPDR